MKPLAIYVHIPFCIHKCSYCDFNSYAGLDHLTYDFCDAIRQEVEKVHLTDRIVTSVFFGGGTPTYLEASQLTDILNTIHATFPFTEVAEITSESNPANSDVERFCEMKEGGFNRLSLGVQAFDDRILRIAERQHTSEDAKTAIRCARQAGFENVNIDLIFALPAQSLDNWRSSLQEAINQNPDHISTYALSIEEGTPFAKLHQRHMLHRVDEDTELEMYEMAIRRLSEGGYQHYEVSNFARPGREARHNLAYWRNEEYLGFGPGAVSYLDGCRWTNEKRPVSYIHKIRQNESLVIQEETLSPLEAMSETIILGLRLRRGISLEAIGKRFDLDAHEIYGGLMEQLLKEELVEYNGDILRLTHKGLLFSNDVFIRILP